MVGQLASGVWSSTKTSSCAHSGCSAGATQDQDLAANCPDVIHDESAVEATEWVIPQEVHDLLNDMPSEASRNSWLNIGNTC
jgi:hypothetical protein